MTLSATVNTFLLPTVPASNSQQSRINALHLFNNTPKAPKGGKDDVLPKKLCRKKKTDEHKEPE